MRRRLVALLLALPVLAAGCSTGHDTPRVVADYTPVPDAALFAKVKDLPDVQAARLSFNDTPPEYTYVATVTARPGADAEALADTIIAILRDGRFRAAVTLAITQDGRQVYVEGFRWPDLDKSFGPQPSRPAGD